MAEKYMGKVLEHYVAVSGSGIELEDPDFGVSSAISDLLIDLMHVAAEAGIDFDERLGHAWQVHEEELRSRAFEAGKEQADASPDEQVRSVHMPKVVRVKWRQTLGSEVKLTPEEFGSYFPKHGCVPLEEALEVMAWDARDFEFEYDDRGRSLETVLDEKHEVLNTSIDVSFEN